MVGEIDFDKPLTRAEFLAYMEDFEDRLKGRRTNLISRQEIIREIGLTGYCKGVRKGYLTPLKNGFKNSKVRIDRREYKAYLEYLKR